MTKGYRNDQEDSKETKWSINSVDLNIMQLGFITPHYSYAVLVTYDFVLKLFSPCISINLASSEKLSAIEELFIL